MVSCDDVMSSTSIDGGMMRQNRRGAVESWWYPIIFGRFFSIFSYREQHT